MRTLGFTGTRHVKWTDAEMVLDDREKAFSEFDHFVTGACRGWDAIAGKWLLFTFPDAAHTVIVPSNRSQVSEWWRDDDVREFVESPGFTGSLVVDYPSPGLARDFRRRNEMIVDLADHLFYLADYMESDSHSTRSGTWMTVRIARRKGIPLDGMVLNA